MKKSVLRQIIKEEITKILLFEVTSGDRVKIVYKRDWDRTHGLGQYFHNKTGTIISIEKDGRTNMFRVRLDSPVMLPVVGKVTDDLWAAEYLRKI